MPNQNEMVTSETMSVAGHLCTYSAIQQPAAISEEGNFHATGGIGNLLLIITYSTNSQEGNVRCSYRYMLLKNMGNSRGRGVSVKIKTNYEGLVSKFA